MKIDPLMNHFNGDILCAVDVETTGLKPGTHDLIQIAIFPLNYRYNYDKRFRPFDILIKPGRPENIDYDAMSVNKLELADITLRGQDAMQAADLFDIWFDKLELAFNKRIVPIAHNWPHDRGFIMDWLGPKNFEAKFSHKYRDTMCVSLFENDHAHYNSQPFPYPKHDLTYLCNTLGVPLDRAHRALEDARATAECYKILLQNKVSSFQQIRIKELTDALIEVIGDNKSMKEKYSKLLKDI